jgi:DNA transformation protein and related proteins
MDQLDGLGDVVPRKMFGGVGLYVRGLFFGILANDALYLKADAHNRSQFEAAGSTPFRPYVNRAGSMTYYEVPLGILESAEDLVRWARASVRAAERAARGV